MDFKKDILPLKDLLFRTALRILMSREEAEDVVQDVLVRLWQRRDELGDVKNVESFAMMSARNLALDRKALHANRVVSFDADKHDAPNEEQRAGWGAAPDAQMIEEEGVGRIARLVDALPEKQRTILHLRDIEGKTYKEIAETLQLTESDVKVTLFRARAALKSKLMQAAPLDH